MENGKGLKKKVGCILLAALLIAGMIPGRVPEGVLAADVQDDIAVEKVEFGENATYATENHSDHPFIKGVDISTYDALWNSGVRYHDFDGQELESYDDFFILLKESGVNWVRIRVWNDPFNRTDEVSHKDKGYGAGNVDAECAARMGAAATRAGLRVLVDFHYSDFWADPGKCRAPKEWEGKTVSEMADAIETYTKDTLTSMITGNVDVGMVQVGNETTRGLCGFDDQSDMCTLFKAGSAAVREVAAENNQDILIALHFESPQEEGLQAGWAETLDREGVDYDVFASSYYPYWHGTLDNLNEVLSEIANTYDKKVMVAETSWAYTEDDADGNGNVIPERGDTSAYEVSVQGQANQLRDVIDTIAHTKNGIGVFYWEPAWIPRYCMLEGYDNYDAQAMEKNIELWETYGTGWSSTHLGEYAAEGEEISEDRISGSEWENQALFTFDGYPLASLKTWAYVDTIEDSRMDSYWAASDSFWQAMQTYWSKFESYYGAEEKGITGALQVYEDAWENDQNILKIIELYQNACDAYNAVEDAASALTEAYEVLKTEYQALSAIERMEAKEDYQAVETDYDIAMESCSGEVLDNTSVVVSEESKVQASADAPNTLIHAAPADILGNITLSKEEKEDILSGKTTDVVLTVKNAQPKAEEEKLAEEKLDGYEIGQYLDLTLLLNIGEDYSKAITDLEQPVRITITIPESLINKDAAKERAYRIIRIHNSAATPIDGTYDKAGGTLTFETDKFSVYAIVYKDVVKINQDLNNTESESESSTQNTVSSQGTNDTQSGDTSSQGTNDTQSGDTSSQGTSGTQSGDASSQGTNDTQSGDASSQGTNGTQSNTSSNTGDIHSSVYGMLLLIGVTAVLVAAKRRKSTR